MRNALIFLFAILSIDTAAQIDSTSTGEVVDAEIVIEKNKKIILPEAGKINTPVEVRNFELDPLTITYEVVEPDFNWPDYKSDVGFKRPNEAFPLSQHQNYVQAGYGNFSSPLLEAGLFKTVNKVKFGSRMFYESFGKGPVEDENSASSTALIDFFAYFKNENFEFMPKISFRRNGYKYYGNTGRLTSGFNSEAQEKASWSNFNLTLDFSGNKKDLSYFLNPSVYSTNQSFVGGEKINKESGLSIESGLNLKLDKTIRTGLSLEGSTGNYQGGIEYNRSLISINPWVSHEGESVRIKAGFKLTSGKNGRSASNSGFYPSASGEWQFTQNWKLYGLIDGGVKWNGLNDLVSDNQFLDDSLMLISPELSSSFGGGIEGSPFNNVTIKAGIALDNYKGMPFYTPSETDSSSLTLSYDDGTVNIVNFQGEAVLSIGSRSTLRANLVLYGYTTESLEKAWHLPTYNFSIFYTHDIKDKIILTTNLIAVGGIKAPINQGDGILSLSSFLDMNLMANYKVSNRASVFMKLDNLFNKEYERYIGYPVRGMTFKLGAGYRF